MKKLNKTKVALAIIIALLVIATIILGIIFWGKNKDKTYVNAGSISQTESEFEPLIIKDIELKYVEERNETILDFAIENKTDEKVEKQKIKIHLLDEKNGLISSLETNVSTIDPKGSHKVNITLAGNIKGINKLKLVKP